MDQFEDTIKQELFEYENVTKEIQDSLVNKNCVLMTIQNNSESIKDEDYNDWFEKVFTNEGTDDSVSRIRDIFDTTDNFEYLGCNSDLSKEILKKLAADK